MLLLFSHWIIPPIVWFVAYFHLRHPYSHRQILWMHFLSKHIGGHLCKSLADVSRDERRPSVISVDRNDIWEFKTVDWFWEWKCELAQKSIQVTPIYHSSLAFLQIQIKREQHEAWKTVVELNISENESLEGVFYLFCSHCSRRPFDRKKKSEHCLFACKISITGWNTITPVSRTTGLTHIHVQLPRPSFGLTL